MTITFQIRVTRVNLVLPGQRITAVLADFGNTGTSMKLPIILMVVFVISIAIGVYFVVTKESDMNGDDMNRATKTNRSSAFEFSGESEISSDIAAALIKSHSMENNGSMYPTDPICRDLPKSSVFVFDCYHQRTFNDLPDNSTVKCTYLKRVGLCIQALLEETYDIDCDLEDRLFLLNLNAETILERSNFNVRTECV
ncbi:uncharacterized protein LOC132545922 [Ylistrum balloti]|uniref:uncharacterized protein LOC132545922 n=1 Tax=Ylistrum balloti TaxID=509963 RepID=UPI002905E31F|nr:uncharacterized protein LOC132545922 [Ylistrum balloti]